MREPPDLEIVTRTLGEVVRKQEAELRQAEAEIARLQEVASSVITFCYHVPYPLYEKAVAALEGK